MTNFVRNLNKSNKTMLMHHNISVNLMFFLISLSFTLVIGHYTVSQKTGLKKTYEICEGVQFFYSQCTDFFVILCLSSIHFVCLFVCLFV